MTTNGNYYNLGCYSRPITTKSKSSQIWFDRGLVWMFGYNHEEAIRCFEKAIQSDPDCIMAHFGIAYAIGPNYNKPWEDAFGPDEKVEALGIATEAIAAAERIIQEGHRDVTDVEKSLIKAIAKRYPTNSPVEDFDPFHDAFAGAMRTVHAKHGNDLDVCFLFAEALMTRTPWKLWNLQTGKPADGADTVEAMSVLEYAFNSLPGAWDHPGLLHLYIHLMEMSPHPEKALRHGDRLTSLVPGSGHLIHMATHIDVLCGEYQNVVTRNHAAILVDRMYLQQRGADNFYTVYRCHNLHFKIYGAMFLGQPKPALEAAEELIENLPESILIPMGDLFEAFVPMKQHVFVRFGMWKDILKQDLPQNETVFCFTIAMMRYARAIALANTGDIAGAEAERDLFFAARDKVPSSRLLFNNTCEDILRIAEHMMLGEVEFRKGNHDDAFTYLRKSVHYADNLPYDEPWGWMQPVRHALGALLLEDGKYVEAEAVYRADLGLDGTLSRPCQHPDNVWSLNGLYECLLHRGEKKEAPHVKLRLDKAIARAEVPIRSSCFCRRKKRSGD